MNGTHLSALFCCASVFTAYAAPPRVTDLRGVGFGTSVRLKWTAPADGNALAELDLRETTDTTAGITTLNFSTRPRDPLTDPGTAGTTQDTVILNLQPNSTYKFGLKVRDSNGWSVLSNVITVTTGSDLYSINLAWQQSSDPNVSGYLIYWGAASGVYTNSIDVGNVTQAALTNLPTDATLYFVVQAYDAQTNFSDFSNELPHTPSAPPNFP